MFNYHIFSKLIWNCFKIVTFFKPNLIQITSFISYEKLTDNDLKLLEERVKSILSKQLLVRDN